MNHSLRLLKSRSRAGLASVFGCGKVEQTNAGCSQQFELVALWHYDHQLQLLLPFLTVLLHPIDHSVQSLHISNSQTSFSTFCATPSFLLSLQILLWNVFQELNKRLLIGEFVPLLQRSGGLVEASLMCCVMNLEREVGNTMYASFLLLSVKIESKGLHFRNMLSNPV
jgi:hypothetical protein